MVLIKKKTCMCTSVTCKLSLYADDSALLFLHSDAAIIAEWLSQELSMCKRWLVDNKLSLHIGKTESLLFGSKRKLRKVVVVREHLLVVWAFSWMST